MSEDRLVVIESTLQVVVERLGDLGDLKQGQAELRREVGELRNHMGVLHEAALQEMRDLIPPPDPIRRASAAELAELRTDMSNELAPLKRVVTEHSVAIRKLERRKG